MQPRLKIGVLYSRVHVQEKWIFAAMERRGLDDPAPWRAYDAVLERSISYNSGLYELRMLNA